MAKNRNKNKRSDTVPMDISKEVVGDIPQAMDASETNAPNSAPGVLNKKIRKGLPMKRSKSLRKKKAIEKAISQMEKSEVKILKNDSKTSRTQSAKKLYE